MTKKSISDEANKLIKDPRFLYRTGCKVTELGLVADDRDRLLIPVSSMTVVLPVGRRVSVMITGDSSSGKSTLIEKPLALVPPELVLKRASFSRRAFAYGEESLDNKLLYVNEYRGGKDDHYLLRILQSGGELSHEYTTSGKTRVVSRLGSPVVLTTSTDTVILEDDATRFLRIRLNPTPEQNLAVFKAAISNNRNKEERMVEVWHEAFRLLIGGYKKAFIFPDWFNYILEQLPSERPRSCRDCNRFLGCVEAIALCRSHVDPSPQISFADYCVAYRIFNPAFTATAYDVSESELAVQTAVTGLAAKLGRAVPIAEVRKLLGWGENMTYKHIREAVKQKLVQYEDGTREKNIKRLLPIEGASNFLPTPTMVLKNSKQLPAAVDFVDPLTGKMLKVVRSSVAD